LNKYDVDINDILVKPIYIGLFMNVFVPVVLLAIGYYIEQSGGMSSLRGEPAENVSLFFWVFLALSVIDGGVAIFLKQWKFYQPMIESKGTFIEDFKKGVFTNSVICYAITTAIAVYGLVVYLLGGTFNQFVLFVFLSFIAFQLIRPRHGFLKKVLEAQENHVESGRFLIPKN